MVQDSLTSIEKYSRFLWTVQVRNDVQFALQNHIIRLKMRIDKKKLYERIAERIKRLRQFFPDGTERTSKITQEELAERVGTTRVTIANFESARTFIPLHSLYLVCRVLNAELEDVLPSISEVEMATEDSKTIEVGSVKEQVPNRLAKELEEIFKDS